MNQAPFHVGEWLVQPQLKRISNGDVTHNIEPQLMAVLAYLADHQGEVITKEQLMAEVWKGVIVSENVLTRAISSLRKILGDNPSQPKYIETISKTGYRFIAEVRIPGKQPDEKVIEFRLKRKPLVIAAAVVLLISFGAFALREVFLPIPDETVYYPQSLASDAIPEYYPAISNDGQFVAFAAPNKEGRDWNIFAKRLGTETLVQLTDHPASELRAVWSQEGHEVYFMRYDQGAHVYKVPMTGGTATRVLTAGQFSKGNFDLSPDGKNLVYNDRDSRESVLQIELTNLDDGTRRFLTNPPKGFNGDIHPTFSPDGSQLAFIREKNPVSMYLYVLDLKTGEERQITALHQSINGFDWTADGNGLIYGADQTGIYKLWQVDLRSGDQKLLPATDYQMVMPRVASNDQMVYAKLQDDVNLWEYDLENGEAKIWRSTTELDLNASHSPDGTQVVFSTNRNGSFQLWKADANGSNAVAITNFIGEYVNTPRWSSDGEYIVFQGYRDGQADLFRVNAEGGIAENLTDSNFEEHTPVYAPDGESVFYSSNRSGYWQVWRMDIMEGRNEQITEAGGYAPQLSAKGELYFVKKDQSGIWKFVNGEEKLVMADFDPTNYGAFALAGDRLYYLNARNRTLDELDLNSGESKALIRTKRPPRMGVTLSYSEAAKTIIYGQVDHIDADIMMLVKQ